MHLVVSVRSPDDLYYADELAGPGDDVVYTRTTPPGYARGPAASRPTTSRRCIVPTSTAYVCGSSGFADAASHLLVDLGVPVHRVRVERFGPTA